MYRLQGKPVGGSKMILDHGLMSVIEDKEQEAPKGEHSPQTPVWGVNLQMGRGS